MRKISIVALGAAAALALAGCASSGAPGEEGASDGAEIRVWIVGTDTPQEARDYLTETFEEENPGSTLVIEEQAWGGLVDKLTTALSGSDSPDVVEVGNTQAAAFTTARAFLDLSGEYEALGGDDLLPGFVEAGTADGAFYAAPYYSGARVVFYDTAMYERLGLEVPATLDEYVANGQAIAEAEPGVSGIYFPGQDWYNALPFIWEHGGEIATVEDGVWTPGFSTDESLEGLRRVQEAMTTASAAPKDGNEAEAQVPFCAGEIGQLSAPSWFKWSILAAADAEAPGCPEKEETLGVFALPGLDGGAAQVFAGGSNIAVSARSANPDLAVEALRIMLSEEYQTILGGAGLVPALTSLGSTVGTDATAEAIAAAAGNAKLTPASPQWAEVEASGVLQDLFVNIAQGGDVEQLAADADERIAEILNP